MKSLITLLTLVCCIAISTSQTIEIELFANGFSSPVDLQNAGDERLFVGERDGIIKILNPDATTESTPFLDIESIISTTGEGGLLGFAFHPDYENNGFFFVHYTNLSGDTQISRFSVSGSDPNVADPNSELQILTVSQPFSNHNGGSIAFGTDGYLYIALGDGGGAGDTANNAQNLNLLLGKMLRLDIDNTSGGQNYSIPADNPFVGDPSARDEIWAYGLRNPYRFSIDDEANNIWIGDVGQNAVEEINRASLTEAGLNYGWRCYEGSAPFNTSNCPAQSELTFPVAEYPWTGGGSVVGGYVYRGSIYADLQNVYVFADITGMIGTVDENLYYVDQGDFGGFWVGLGEDINEELYVVDIAGSIHKIKGGEVLVLNENNKNTLVMSPNPATEFVNFKTQNSLLNSISILDMRGSIVFSEENINSATLDIFVGDLASGVYITKAITNSGNTTIKKLVIK